MKKLQNAPVAREPAATRERLLQAASAIFAEVGYQTATTRRICLRARANAAAVNYHFGDKLGLYTAVLKSVAGTQNAWLPLPAVASLSAAAAIHEYIHAMLENLSGPGPADVYTRIMSHELSEPTPGLAYVVAKIIRPHVLLLCEIVARATGRSATARETRLSAHCIIGQVVHYTQGRPVIKLLWPTWPQDAAARAAIAAHVTEFSLAALRGMNSAMRATTPARSGKRRHETETSARSVRRR